MDAYNNGRHPGLLSGLQCWYDFTNPAYVFTDTGMGTNSVAGDATNGFVGRIINLVPNSIPENRDLVVPVASTRRPSYNVGSVKNYGCAHFDGGFNYTSLRGNYTASGVTGATFWIVVGGTSDNFRPIWQIVNSLTDSPPYNGTNNLYLDTGSGVFEWQRDAAGASPLLATIAYDSSPHLLVCTIDLSGLTGKIWKDGGSASSDAFGSSAGMNWTIQQLGVRTDADTIGVGAANLIDVYEHGFLERVITTTEMNQILRPYIQSKYGFSVAAFS